MFEAKILEGAILKKIVEAIKDVVNDVNIDVSPSGKSNSLNPWIPKSSAVSDLKFAGNLPLIISDMLTK